MRETFFETWHRINVAFKAGKLPWLLHPGGALQARPTRRNPLHDRECQCRSCQFGRSEARLKTRDFLDETRRLARAKIFEEDARGWVRGILTDDE